MNTKILDFLGREIKVGDFAIYSKTANQIAETAICLVVAIKDGKRDWRGDRKLINCFCLTSSISRMTAITFGQESVEVEIDGLKTPFNLEKRKTSISDFRRLTVIPRDAVPTEIVEFLEYKARVSA